MSGGGRAAESGPPSGSAAPRGVTAEGLILAVGAVLAVVIWALAPSAGNYDTVLDLVWARELLDGHAPGFTAYAASTPHPAWLALGVPVVAIFGEHGDRVMVLISALSLAVLAAGTTRLGRIVGTSLVDASSPADAGRAARVGTATGLVAGLLTLTSFAFLLLAAKGYLDAPFLALVAWAAAAAATRPESWRRPALLLTVAGLLRPEAWLLAGGYWLWLALRRRSTTTVASSPAPERDPATGESVDLAEAAAGPASSPGRGGGGLTHLLLVLLAPVLWLAMDWAVTGHTLHSLTATSQLADELGRERGIARAPRLLVSQLIDQARPPVALAGILGLGILLLGDRIGLARPPRRVQIVLGALLGVGVLTFLAAGVGGLSLLPRYLTVPVVALTVLAALAATGWLALDADHRWRRPWMLVVLLGVVLGVGTYVTVKRDATTTLTAELRFLADTRSDVRALMQDPAVVRAARCGPISLPTYRLVPDVRLQLDVDGDRVVARSDPRAAALGALNRGVAITVAEGKPARRYGRADGVPRTTQAAPPGFSPIARRGPFTAWARCP